MRLNEVQIREYTNTDCANREECKRCGIEVASPCAEWAAAEIYFLLTQQFFVHNTDLMNGILPTRPVGPEICYDCEDKENPCEPKNCGENDPGKPTQLIGKQK